MHTTNACAIFETPDYRGSSKQLSHVQGAHDDTQLLDSCQSYCCPSIGFLQLGENLLLRKLRLLLPPLRNPTFVCAKRTKWALLRPANCNQECLGKRKDHTGTSWVVSWHKEQMPPHILLIRSLGPRRRLYGAAITSGTCALSSMRTRPPACRSRTSSHPTTTYIMYEFSGMCENHVRELRTFFTLSQSHVSNVHFFCETLSLPQDFQ